MSTISVILPVYNGLPYLTASVESVLAQTLPDLEFFILDDCSSDGSWEYLTTINDPRVTLLRNETNQGLFYNLNLLIKKSKGDLIKLWAQDDIMGENCLSEIVAFHDRFPQVGFSYSKMHHIDEGGNTIPSKKDDTPEFIPTTLHSYISFRYGCIAGNIANVTLNRKFLSEVGEFNEGMKISADFEMWVRLAQHHPVGFIRKQLIKLRNHSGQLSRKSEYFFLHAKEDLQVYQILLSYVDESMKKEGLNLLRQYQLVYYYTLMVKDLLRGNFKNVMAYYQLLSGFDNFLALSFRFLMRKFFKR